MHTVEETAILKHLHAELTNVPLLGPEQFADTVRVMVIRGAIEPITLKNTLKCTFKRLQGWAKNVDLPRVEELPSLKIDLIAILEVELELITDPALH